MSDSNDKAIGFDVYNFSVTGGVRVSKTLNSIRSDSDHVPVVFTLKVRGGVEVDSRGKKAGKGPLVQENLSATLGVSQDQTLFVPKFLNSSGGV